MSIWLLIMVAVFVWLLVGTVFGFWLGRRFAQQRRGGTIDFTRSVVTTRFPGGSDWPTATTQPPTSVNRAGQSAA